MVKARVMNQAQRNVISVRVGSQWYGIDVENVIEILPMVMLSEPPTSNPDVLGLIVVRNVVMPVVDLRLRFGIAEPQYQLDTPIITLRTERGSIGIVVDEIDNVEHVASENFSTNVGTDFPFLAGTAQIKDRLLMLLNLSVIG